MSKRLEVGQKAIVEIYEKATGELVDTVHMTVEKSGSFSYGSGTCVVLKRVDHQTDVYDTRYWHDGDCNEFARWWFEAECNTDDFRAEFKEAK